MDPYSKESLANAIFLTRTNNDQLLAEATEVALANRTLQNELTAKTSHFPIMLQNWWENNREVEAIAEFMKELSENLQLEIDELTEEIASFKAGREMRTAEQEKE
jgi:hypothetical protein